MWRPVPPLVAVGAAGLVAVCGESGTGLDGLGPINGLPCELSVAERQLIEVDNERVGQSPAQTRRVFGALNKPDYYPTCGVRNT
jgi:hypothetical protein